MVVSSNTKYLLNRFRNICTNDIVIQMPDGLIFHHHQCHDLREHVRVRRCAELIEQRHNMGVLAVYLLEYASVKSWVWSYATSPESAAYIQRIDQQVLIELQSLTTL